MKKQRILWVDDEIELLKSHVIFLSEKGYDIDTVTNGYDAIEKNKEVNYDLIFLDEMMPGMGGLETLSQIKEINPRIPIVMVTKSEEESLMNDAIGGKIDDYIIKPVVPSQMLLVCKKLLDKKKISGEYAAKDYLSDFTQISNMMLSSPNYREWVDIALKLVNWDLELDKHPGIGLHQTLHDQRREANQEFSKFVEKNYLRWVSSDSGDSFPKLTPEITPDYVFPHLRESAGPVFYFVIDCLRIDQWMVMEKYLVDTFNITKDYYYSILPTATPYSRNSLFAGLYPSEIEKYFPHLWASGDDESSQNMHEKEFLSRLLERKRIKLRNELKYIKIIDPEVGKAFEQNISVHSSNHLTAVVVNFLDMIAHGRSDSDLLKEIAPDEAAYRSLTESWFKHSSLLGALRSIAQIKGARIVITTDHGSIRTMRGAKVLGDRESSTNLRFKYGKNLKADDKNAIFIRNPQDYKLPRRGITINYIIAKEDYYFVYPTEYHRYLSHYKDTFQHGGISIEEMILPVITLDTK
ncbi:MAG: response regulator [Ignavibacteriales bacterium]|nr:response regulator [Ignavibacteriales bacterium]MCF8314697.1 response regulator [Ignavibacteriales bacterium]MCF8438055.1 response regulator [Ignavibacteriales bacterium]